MTTRPSSKLSEPSPALNTITPSKAQVAANVNIIKDSSTKKLHLKEAPELSIWTAIGASALELKWLQIGINPYHTHIPIFNFGNSNIN